MYYIVGLGNPGEEYTRTRHNLGWWVLDAAIGSWRLPATHNSSTYSGRMTEGVVEGSEVTLLYPETFMNNSGAAVAKLLPPKALSQLVVIYDDVDLPRGTFKVSFDGGAGGHNGVFSIVESIGSGAFIRLRIGIAPTHAETGAAVRPAADKLAAYVLGAISTYEASVYEEVIPQAVEALKMVVTKGYEAAMNTYN